MVASSFVREPSILGGATQRQERGRLSLDTLRSVMFYAARSAETSAFQLPNRITAACSGRTAGLRRATAADAAIRYTHPRLEGGND